MSTFIDYSINITKPPISILLSQLNYAWNNIKSFVKRFVTIINLFNNKQWITFNDKLLNQTTLAFFQPKKNDQKICLKRRINLTNSLRCTKQNWTIMFGILFHLLSTSHLCILSGYWKSLSISCFLFFPKLRLCQWIWTILQLIKSEMGTMRLPTTQLLFFYG